MVYICTYMYIYTTAARLQSLTSQRLHPSPLKTIFCKSLEAVTCPCKATCQKGLVSSSKHDVYTYIRTCIYMCSRTGVRTQTWYFTLDMILCIYRERVGSPRVGLFDRRHRRQLTLAYRRHDGVTSRTSRLWISHVTHGLVTSHTD